MKLPKWSRSLAHRHNHKQIYTYPPLKHPDSIRLLTLAPGNFSSQICISLAEVRTQEEYPYEALSYTWATESGDSLQSSHIQCGNQRIQVTKNCELALRYLRKEHSGRVLWVDAICIDQENDKERGHQVQIMRDIYVKATEVLVWLGEASEFMAAPLPVTRSALVRTPGSTGVSDEGPRDAPQAAIPVSEIFLDFLDQMATEMRQLQIKKLNRTRSPLYQELLSQVHENFVLKKVNALCQGFNNIVKRPWWYRVWVIQEVVLAKSVTVVCSKQSISYRCFTEFFKVLCDDITSKASTVMAALGGAQLHLSSVYYALRLNNTDSASEDLDKILRVLQRVRHLQASKPVDKIFGILGLSDKFRSLLQAPDYSKDATKVFTNVTNTFLEQTKSLSILNEVNSTKFTPGHPSWVPDWSGLPVIRIGYSHENAFTASRNSQPIFKISSNNQELRLKGKRFDSVKEKDFTDSQAYQYTAPLAERILGWRKSCAAGQSLETYPTGEPVEDVLWRSLCWNLSVWRKSPAPSAFKHNFDIWYDIITLRETFDNIATKLDVENITFLENIISESPLCVTLRGYLAGVPCTTEPGDEIVVLAGGKLPYILRPTKDYYRLVGPCYVHGIMNGEAFPDDSEDLEWFAIR